LVAAPNATLNGGARRRLVLWHHILTFQPLQPQRLAAPGWRWIPENSAMA